MTVQLRRYELIPAERDEFVAWWRAEIPRLREAHGFTIVFAYLIEETSEFVWAVSYPGDAAAFAAAEAALLMSPDRHLAFDGVPQRVRAMRVHLAAEVT